MLKAIQLKNSEQYIKDNSKKNNEPEWMLNKRLKAYEIFKDKPMPNFIYGLNIDMNIDLNLDDVDTKKSGPSNLDIKNNDRNIIIENFEGMLNNHENILKTKFMSLVPATNKFTSFHYAFLKNLTFVYIPKNVEVKEPIELISTINSDVVFEHLIILAEDNTKVTIVENSKSNNKTIENNFDNKNIKDELKTIGNSNAYRSKIVEIFIGNNTTVNYGNVQLLDQKTFNFTIKKASVGTNSTINWMDCCFGSKTTLSEVTSNLDGPQAKTNNYGIFFGSKQQQFDLVVNSIHNAPNTKSIILTKGALIDSSKCLYRGLVKIQQNASKSNGYQKQDTLLLSENAIADSIPNLEIDNNDVRCTHGASIGKIDTEKMFYMQSRGLNEDLATKEYVKGFFEPLIQKIKIKNLQDNMHDMIEERMK